MDALWPGLDHAAGTRRLNKALHFARRALSAEHVRISGEMLSLEAADLWIDVDALEAAVGRGDTEEALRLYAGDLLPEDRFEPWVQTPGAQLSALVVRLLLDQASAREAHGDLPGAVLSLERLVGMEPLHEEAYGRLIRLTATAGDRHVALRWYARLIEVLRDELGISPSEELRRLHGEIAAGRLGSRLGSAAEAIAPEVVAPAPSALVPAIEQERRLVTVLAADLRGVRGEAEDADPERSRRRTGACTDALCDVLGGWDGAVERLVGGGAVAVFGYPAAREDHADRALCAGFEALRRVPAAVRIGVATGEVIAPTTRSGSISDIGGIVFDAAALLREAARPRTLLATERTQQAARWGDFLFGDALQLEGWGGQALRARRLLAATWAADWRQPESEPPMVGRDDEMQAILSLVEEVVASGTPRLLTVVGVAGVGKSRLLREVVAATRQRRQDMQVLRGRCLPAGDGVTYWALGEILRSACGIALGETAEVAQEKLRVTLHELLSSVQVSDTEVEATIFALAATAAIRLPGNPLDSAPPRAVADELARAWPRFATALTARGPLLMVIEDLHWAGTSLLEMLARLVSRSAGPLALFTTARPEFRERDPGFGGRTADLSMISLRPLTERSSRELLDSLPRGQALDAHRRRWVLARAEGNPYFLEELVAHITDGAPGSLPDTLHSLLSARVDALPLIEKRLLQTASVVGRVFWIESIRGRLGTGDIAVSDALTSLESRGLLLARQGSSLAGQREFAFKHALLRDVAYASLPTALRARGHADVASWLEDVSRESIDEVIELIAYHYSSAATSDEADLAWPDEPGKREWVRTKAFRSLIEAGVGARRRYAIPKALTVHRDALRIAVGVGERAEAAEAIGDDHEAAYHGDAALLAWEDALAVLRREPGRLNWRASLCLKTAQMAVTRFGGFRVTPDPSVSDRIIDEGLAVVGDPSVRAQLLSLRALCAARWGATGKSDPVPVAARRRAAEAGRRLAEELGSPPLKGLALFGLSAVYFEERAYDEAVEAILEEVDLMDQGGRDRDRALGHAIASIVVADVRGDYEQALAHARSSYALAEGLSPHDRLHGTCLIMACLGQLGRWSEVEPFLQEHVSLLDGPEAEMSCPYIRGGPFVGAIALCHLGDEPGARRVADRVTPDLDHPGYAEALRGRLAIELGDPAAARSLTEALVLKGRRPGPEEIPPESLVLVEALEAQGDWEALERFLPTARSMSGFLAAMTPTCDRAEGLARAAAGAADDAALLLSRAVDGFERLSLSLQAARARERMALVIPPRAHELLRSALDVYRKLGAVRDTARAETALIAVSH
jgi:DNA-binding SARP family transcriptional activator/tetratricopeptide (TPR) repeat protein